MSIQRLLTDSAKMLFKSLANKEVLTCIFAVLLSLYPMQMKISSDIHVRIILVHHRWAMDIGVW